MSKKINPKDTQAEFFCKRLDKLIYVAKNAYAINNNWLCECGYFIKDDPSFHRIIRQGERIPDKYSGHNYGENTSEKEYEVLYWNDTGKEMRTKVMAKTLLEAIQKVNTSHVKIYCLFLNGHNIYCNGDKNE